MHAVVMDSLEEFLSGTLEPATQRDIEAHLSACRVCREEIGSMQEMSQWFLSLKHEETVEPAAAGFYERVMRQMGEPKAAPSWAAFLALDLGFGRRLAFASLLTLAVLGGYLVSRETGYPGGPSPEAIMA